MVCMNSRWLHFASAFRFATCACSFCDTHSSLAFLCVSVRSRAIWTLTSSQLPPFNISSLGRCRVLLLCTLSICPFFANCLDPSRSLTNVVPALFPPSCHSFTSPFHNSATFFYWLFHVQRKWIEFIKFEEFCDIKAVADMIDLEITAAMWFCCGSRLRICASSWIELQEWGHIVNLCFASFPIKWC